MEGRFTIKLTYQAIAPDGTVANENHYVDNLADYQAMVVYQAAVAEMMTALNDAGFANAELQGADPEEGRKIREIIRGRGKP